MPATPSRLHADFQRNGYVLLRNVLSPAECRASADELWRLACQQPELDEFRLTPPEDPFASFAKERKPSWRWLRACDAHFPYHKAFGAPTVPGSFHTECAWRQRTSPEVVRAFAALLGCSVDDLRMHPNRHVFKLPFAGKDDEFLHWDANLYEPWPDRSPLQAILFYADTSFVCVPGSHTEEFHAAFRAAYPRELVQDGKKKQKTTLRFLMEDRDVREVRFPADVLPSETIRAAIDEAGGLRAAFRVDVPAGSLLIWSRRLLHGASKNGDTFRYGLYLSYDTAERFERDVLSPVHLRPALDFPHRQEEPYQSCVRSEHADRLHSYLTGRAPAYYAGVDPVRYVPSQAYGSAEARAARLLPREGLRGTGKQGQPIPIEYDPRVPWFDGYEPYVPRELGARGRRLLGTTEEELARFAELLERAVRRGAA